MAQEAQTGQKHLLTWVLREDSALFCFAHTHLLAVAPLMGEEL